jgi:hypothetical protein
MIKAGFRYTTLTKGGFIYGGIFDRFSFFIKGGEKSGANSGFYKFQPTEIKK